MKVGHRVADDDRLRGLDPELVADEQGVVGGGLGLAVGVVPADHHVDVLQDAQLEQVANRVLPHVLRAHGDAHAVALEGVEELLDVGVQQLGRGPQHGLALHPGLVHDQDGLLVEQALGDEELDEGGLHLVLPALGDQPALDALRVLAGSQHRVHLLAEVETRYRLQPETKNTHTESRPSVNTHKCLVNIAQWVHPMKDRSDDPSHHERTLLPRSYKLAKYKILPESTGK